MRRFLSVFAAVAMLFPCTSAWADVVEQGALAKLPVKEITVFKDGHAFVLHEGALPVDDNGAVHMDYLPTPVIGTFWPYAADPKTPLASVVVGKQPVRVKRTALNLREMIEANVGAKALIQEKGKDTAFAATIVSIPQRDAAELAATSPANSPPRLPEKGQLIVLKTAAGYKVIDINRIQEVTFLDEPQSKSTHEEFRNLLSLHLAWPGEKPGKSASVGMVYLQKGVRWIPNYKVTIDGKGNALVKLQATVLNELTDLNDVTAHLVIGVPSFNFAGTVDPIALGQTVSQLSQHFQPAAQTGFAFSNAIMTQLPANNVVRVQPRQGGNVDLGPDVAVSGKREDLFLFTLKDVSLKKGERMVVPVAEFSLAYKDVYQLHVPVAPPPEVRRNFNSSQQSQLAKLFHEPKVKHLLRLANDSQYPLTTAPALIQQGDRLLGQGMMSYTPIGGKVDLSITTAVDVSAKKEDKETNRVPNAMQWGGYSYDRVDLEGEIALTNFGKKLIDVEVVRYVLGVAESETGQAVKINVYEDGWQLAGGAPHWWGWYGWPGWWHHLNGVSRITWDVKLEAGKSAKLNYKWHYFWRH